MKYLRIRGSEFVLGDQPIRLRGVGLGNWLNLEHFMLGIPGTESEIRATVSAVYGTEGAERFWDEFYAAYTSDADLQFVRELRMNSLRVPVNYHLFDTKVAYRELDRLIEMAAALQLLVVIDLHAAPGGQNPDWHSDNSTGEAGFWRNEEHQASVIRLWEQLALRYRDSTTVAGYDLVNEPSFADSAQGETLVSFYTRCIAAIRRVDPNHVIFIEGNRYARDFSMFTSNLDEQVAYSFHYYPFIQLPNELDASDLGPRLEARLFAETSLEYLQDVLKKPVFCGETGHALHLARSASVLEMFLSDLEARGISWAVWPLKDARAMGLLGPGQATHWMRLVGELTDHWSFWDLFSQDSLLTVGGSQEGTQFYHRLAQATTDAHARFRERLVRVTIDELCAAVKSFAFDCCEQQTALLEPLRAVLGRRA